MNRTVRNGLPRSISDWIEQGASRAEVEVRIEIWVLVVLHTEIVITQAEIQGETRPDFPGIVDVSVPVAVTIASRKVRRTNWQRDRVPREFSLRKYGGLK